MPHPWTLKSVFCQKTDSSALNKEQVGFMDEECVPKLRPTVHLKWILSHSEVPNTIFGEIHINKEAVTCVFTCYVRMLCLSLTFKNNKKRNEICLMLP